VLQYVSCRAPKPISAAASSESKENKQLFKLQMLKVPATLAVVGIGQNSARPCELAKLSTFLSTAKGAKAHTAPLLKLMAAKESKAHSGCITYSDLCAAVTAYETARLEYGVSAELVASWNTVLALVASGASSFATLAADDDDDD
jgi:hypothetical protein